MTHLIGISHIIHASNLRRKFPESIYLAEAGIKKGLMIMAVVPKPNDGTKGLSISSSPTAAALLEAGMHQVYEPPHSSKFDIVECAVSSASGTRSQYCATKKSLTIYFLSSRCIIWCSRPILRQSKLNNICVSWLFSPVVRPRWIFLIF